MFQFNINMYIKIYEYILIYCIQFAVFIQNLAFLIYRELIIREI